MCVRLQFRHLLGEKIAASFFAVSRIEALGARGFQERSSTEQSHDNNGRKTSPSTMCLGRLNLRVGLCSPAGRLLCRCSFRVLELRPNQTENKVQPADLIVL